MYVKFYSWGEAVYSHLMETKEINVVIFKNIHLLVMPQTNTSTGFFIILLLTT